MKYIFYPLIFTLFITGCSSNDDDINPINIQELEKIGVKPQQAEPKEEIKPIITKTITNLEAQAIRDMWHFGLIQPHKLLEAGITIRELVVLSVAGPFTKFDFSTGTTTESETDWDIAFRDTTIIVNGGTIVGAGEDEPARNGNAAAALLYSAFDKVTAVPDPNSINDNATENDYVVRDFKFIQDGDGRVMFPLDPNEQTSPFRLTGDTGVVTYPTAIVTGNNNGWYHYDKERKVTITLPNRTLLFRTRDGEHYAKLEILNFYKDAPNTILDNSGDFGYYTFRYTYNPNKNAKNFE